MDDFSYSWDIQLNVFPSDMNLTDLEVYGAESYFGYPTPSGFGQITTIDQLHGNGNMTGASVNALEGQRSEHCSFLEAWMITLDV